MDIWDWLKGLKRWWWMLLVIPMLAAGLSWVLAPQPKYESTATILITFNDPSLANSLAYVDFIVLDDMKHLLDTGVLGDVVYPKLPEAVRESLSREDFGATIESRRRARFVKITVSHSDQATVDAVMSTVLQELPDAVNHYLIPNDYRYGKGIISVVDQPAPAAINSEPRLRVVGSVTIASVLVALAATGVAEWLRMSYRAKYDAR